MNCLWEIIIFLKEIHVNSAVFMSLPPFPLTFIICGRDVLYLLFVAALSTFIRMCLNSQWAFNSFFPDPHLYICAGSRSKHNADVKTPGRLISPGIRDLLCFESISNSKTEETISCLREKTMYGYRERLSVWISRYMKPSTAVRLFYHTVFCVHHLLAGKAAVTVHVVHQYLFIRLFQV